MITAPSTKQIKCFRRLFKWRTSAMGACFTCLFLQPASAAPILNSATGLASPANTVTFTELTIADDTLLTNEYTPLGIKSFSGLYQVNVPFQLNPNIGPGIANNVAVPTAVFDDFSFMFTGPQSAAAFALAQTTGNSTTVSAYLNNFLVESLIARPDPLLSEGLDDPNNFFGFEGIVFDEIRLSTSNVGGSTGRGIDNIKFNPAQVLPDSVPGPLPLIGVGVAFGMTRRLRTRISNSKSPS
jgi:hypothetical protein